jgi:hypothetical protein
MTPEDMSGRMEAENGRLRKAIERALQCTPQIRQQYVGLAGLTYRQVITYDCGDPWAILREALLPEPVDPIEAIARRLIDQQDEPCFLGGNDAKRLHYWRDKAIAAANDLRALASGERA